MSTFKACSQTNSNAYWFILWPKTEDCNVSIRPFCTLNCDAKKKQKKTKKKEGVSRICLKIDEKSAHQKTNKGYQKKCSYDWNSSSFFGNWGIFLLIIDPVTCNISSLMVGKQVYKLNMIIQDANIYKYLYQFIMLLRLVTIFHIIWKILTIFFLNFK